MKYYIDVNIKTTYSPMAERGDPVEYDGYAVNLFVAPDEFEFTPLLMQEFLNTLGVKSIIKKGRYKMELYLDDGDEFCLPSHVYANALFSNDLLLRTDMGSEIEWTRNTREKFIEWLKQYGFKKIKFTEI